MWETWKRRKVFVVCGKPEEKARCEGNPEKKEENLGVSGGEGRESRCVGNPEEKQEKQKEVSTT